jgi:hypothetical protein
MNKNEYAELQKTLAEVNAALSDEDLSDELRAQLEASAAALSGQILSIWLPMSDTRRAIMLVLFLIGLRAFANNNEIYVVYWIATALFSPRIVGEAAYYFGRLTRGFK